MSSTKFNEGIQNLLKRDEKFNEDVILTYDIDREKKQFVFKKWELSSSHTGRRSYCTNEYIKNRPIRSIMAISGHETESSFRRYIRVSSVEHSELMTDENY